METDTPKRPTCRVCGNMVCVHEMPDNLRELLQSLEKPATIARPAFVNWRFQPIPEPEPNTVCHTMLHTDIKQEVIRESGIRDELTLAERRAIMTSPFPRISFINPDGTMI